MVLNHQKTTHLGLLMNGLTDCQPSQNQNNHSTEATPNLMTYGASGRMCLRVRTCQQSRRQPPATTPKPLATTHATASTTTSPPSLTKTRLLSPVQMDQDLENPEATLTVSPGPVTPTAQELQVLDQVRIPVPGSQQDQVTQLKDRVDQEE
eukprot:XP_011680620.1 PREDICTED: uncharacterized protein LOC100892516 [Strongylocentrotus purpuratus]